jgi:hypothetical protein
VWGQYALCGYRAERENGLYGIACRKEKDYSGKRSGGIKAGWLNK